MHTNNAIKDWMMAWVKYTVEISGGKAHICM